MISAENVCAQDNTEDGAIQSKAAIEADSGVQLEQDECPLNDHFLPKWWTGPEIWAWKAVCRGEVAQMDRASGSPKDETSCDALNEQEIWPETSRLSARFIEQIVTDKRFLDAARRPSVRISCAYIEGLLDFEDQIVAPTLWLDSSRIPSGVNFKGARFLRDLTFDGSFLLPGLLEGSAAKIAGNLGLRNGIYNGLNLTGSQIERFAWLMNADFRGTVDLSNAKVGADLAMSNSKFAAETALIGTSIGGIFDISGSTFEKFVNAQRIVVSEDLLALDATKLKAGISVARAIIGQDISIDGLDSEASFTAFSASVGRNFQIIDSNVTGVVDASGMSVSGNFNLKYTDASAVGLSEAYIGGSLVAIEATVGLLNATNAVIERDAYISDESTLGTIVFDDARILSDFLVFTTTIQEALSLDNAKIEGRLVLSKEVPFLDIDNHKFQGQAGYSLHPAWGENATFSLVGTQVGALEAAFPESWVSACGNGCRNFINYDLARFEYGRLDLANRANPLSELDIDSRTLIDWLRNSTTVRCEDCPVVFNPKPYAQLAAALEELGAHSQSEAVTYAGKYHRMETRDEYWPWFVDQISRWIVGFGVYPERALAWFAGLLGLGIVCSYWSSGLARKGLLERFWYSLENTLPFVELSKDHAEIRHESKLAQNFFHAQKVLGFLLATILVAALTIFSG